MSLVLLSAMAAAAAQTQGVSPAGAVAPAGKKPPLICVDDAPIGSRLGGRRICRSAADWRRDQQEVRADTERAQRLNKLPGR